MHLKSLVKRNWVEGWLVFAGIVILVIQFAVAKHFLSDGGTDHTHIIGAPLDDTYIHARYTENLKSGKGYTFNVTENIDDSLYAHPIARTVSADTSPLWVAFIAIGGIFSSRFDLIAIILSAFAWLLLAPGVYRFARYILVWEQSFSIAAGIAMLLAPRLITMALSGMETTFATLLVLIAIATHIRSREMNTLRLREAVMLGVGIAIRPEFYLLVFIAAADWLYVIIKKQISPAELLKFALPILFFVYFVVIPYSGNGSLLYHSSIVQGAGFRFPPDFYYVGRAFYLMLENIWWIVLLLFFYLASFRLPKLKINNAFIILFMILLPVVQGFVAPQYRHFGRYVFIIFPLVMISAFALLKTNMLSEKGFSFFRTMKDSKRVMYLSAIAIIFSLPLAIKWTKVYAESVRNINDQHLAVTEWAEQNTTDKIAAQDVGALGYFTKRNIIDLTGLVSPEFYPLQKDQSLVWKEARRQGANYFIIYQRLNPSFYQYAKDSLELVKEFRVRPPLVSSADTVMSVFKVKGM